MIGREEQGRLGPGQPAIGGQASLPALLDMRGTHQAGIFEHVAEMLVYLGKQACVPGKIDHHTRRHGDEANAVIGIDLVIEARPFDEFDVARRSQSDALHVRRILFGDAGETHCGFR